jgi:hypothetical protein
VDYQSNSKKAKQGEQKPEKDIQPVVTGQVIVQKRSLGRKFRDLFIEADIKSVMRYVVSDVLLPAARNTIVDASTKGIERMMYGESAIRRRNWGTGPRITTYNSPINRGYRDGVPPRNAPPVTPGPRTLRNARDDFILSSREEGELLIERMQDILDTYEVVSVADLNALVGFPTSHIDNKWGWHQLGDVQVRQVREGFLVDLPQAEPID